MINLSAVRKTGNRPRVHGNGFIQLDLTKESRLHIWGDPRIPRQKVATTIHDHVFGFESTIIVGRLINVVYAVEGNHAYGDYQVYIPAIREKEDTILEATPILVVADPVHVDMVRAGTDYNKYGILHGQFHESFAPDGPAATIIVKDAPTQAQGAKELPRVLVPMGEEPDNDFNRYDADEDLLWKIIEETLKRRKG